MHPVVDTTISVINAAGWFIAPGFCHLCLLPSERPRDLCRYCEAALPWQVAPCPRCALSPREAQHADHPHRVGALCVACQTGQGPLGTIEHAIAPLAYRNGGRWLVQQQKHRRGVVAARLLAELLADTILLNYPVTPETLPDLIVPVPLHPWRRLRRGHNQAELLGRWLAGRLQVPLLPHAARRVRATPSQQGLSYAARQANMLGAFRATPAVAGLRIAIVDDVLTTGATTRALAAALSTAGAAQVHVWAAVRAPALRTGAAERTC